MRFLRHEHQIGVVGDDLTQQRRAILEVEIELALADVCAVDHVVEARPRDAALTNQRRGRGDDLTEESAIQVDLSKETVRLPLYKGKANGETVWYVLLDASDQGIAHDLGVNYAPKLGNIAIGDPEAVRTVTLDSPTPDQNKFGQAVVNFQDAPDFSPTRIAEPVPTGFALAKFQLAAVAGPGY